MSARAKSPTPGDRRELASERSEVRIDDRPRSGPEVDPMRRID
jgi:hypothetical protein